MRRRGLLSVRFEVDDPTRAYQVGLETLGDVQLHVDGNEVEILATREQIPGFNQHFVQAGINVYAIRSHVKTLEDKFFELTGGGNDVYSFQMKT